MRFCLTVRGANYEGENADRARIPAEEKIRYLFERSSPNRIRLFSSIDMNVVAPGSHGLRHLALPSIRTSSPLYLSRRTAQFVES